MNITITPEERKILDKALRLYRDKHYRHQSEVSAETYEKNQTEFDRAEKLRDKVNGAAHA